MQDNGKNGKRRNGVVSGDSESAFLYYSRHTLLEAGQVVKGLKLGHCFGEAY